jgi:hypothetical protein
VSKDRQRKRKKAAARAGALHPTKGWQKTVRRPAPSLEESAWVALTRHIVEPFQALHQDDDPEQPAGFVLHCLFELGYNWSKEQTVSFDPVPLEVLMIECLTDPAPFEREAVLAGIDELAAAKLLVVEGDMIRLTVEQDVLDRVNKGERLLD